MPLKFLDPPGLSRVGNMELVAKQVVEGFLTGRHRSPYHGFSVESLDHRPYTPGDDMGDGLEDAGSQRQVSGQVVRR